jgi:hypothetical protein
VLYLEAEAAGVRATGIGCFFDDPVHEIVAVKGLSLQTLYHFTVKSADSEGNMAASSELTFTTEQSNSTSLAFSRFSSGADVLGTDTMIGLGLANLSSEPAALTFTSSEDDGNFTSGQDITNPVASQLNPGEQLPIIDWEVFEAGLKTNQTAGSNWIATTPIPEAFS